jgi:hypothetical protein
MGKKKKRRNRLRDKICRERGMDASALLRDLKSAMETFKAARDSNGLPLFPLLDGTPMFIKRKKLFRR